MNIQNKFDICTRGLREYAKGAGFSDVVIGLSGGIDSSVVAVMCVHVFGAEHVHGVLMPGPFSSKNSIEDALALAKNLHIDTQTISINEPYEAFTHVLAQPCTENAHSATSEQKAEDEQDAEIEQNTDSNQNANAFTGTPAENTQARCRMIVLMALSNAHNYMLVNTGNKTEALLGYSTLYGDTAGAFAPIGCLYKTDVFEMARYMNSAEFVRDVFTRDVFSDEHSEANARNAAHASDASERNASSCPLIPENVLIKPPSAELSPDQEDEKCLGLPYALLDKILIAHFEHSTSASEIAEQLEQDSEFTEFFNGTKDAKRENSPQIASTQTNAHITTATVQNIISTAKGFAFKRAMEPPYPQDKIY